VDPVTTSQASCARFWPTAASRPPFQDPPRCYVDFDLVEMVLAHLWKRGQYGVAPIRLAKRTSFVE
jgi:hypothetical protein